MSNLSIAHRRMLAILAMLVGWSAAGTAWAATGEENFTKICAACHMIGGVKLVGPDLAGVTTRRTEEWLVKFIKSPKAMIDAGDVDAVALFNANNKVMMPDAPYNEAEIKDILAFIATRSGGAVVAKVEPPPVREATPAEIEKGGDLFQGVIRLKNGGAPCNSCHHVKNDAVIGGGVLAKELTTIFDTGGGGPGITAILGKPPHAVMARAYNDRPLTEEEVTALVGFLQDANKRHELQQPRDFGFRLMWGGAAGLIPLMGLFSLVWRRRKVRPVNEKIFDRQVKGADDVSQ